MTTGAVGLFPFTVVDSDTGLRALPSALAKAVSTWPAVAKFTPDMDQELKPFTVVVPTRFPFKKRVMTVPAGSKEEPVTV